MILLLSDHFFLSYFNTTKIPWDQSVLRWEDYKDSFINHQNENYYDSNGNRFDSKFVNAITANAIKYKINTKGSIPSVVVGAYFLPNESYVKDVYMTDNQLNHESGFVDICEYHARLIREIFKMKTTGMVNYKALYIKYKIHYIDDFYSDEEIAERLIERIIQMKEEMNEKYMFETEFGRNLENQKKWDKKIQKLLTNLEEFI